MFPGIQGGPLMHVIAGKAICFGEALRPTSSNTPSRSSTMPRPWPRRLLAGGVRLVSGGTDNHLMLADVTPLGLAGKQAEEALGALRHHREQEHDSLRRAQAARSLGHPHRHAGPDHARHGHGRNEGDRRLDSGSAQGAGRHGLAHRDPQRSFVAVRAVSRCRPRRWPTSTAKRRGFFSSRNAHRARESRPGAAPQASGWPLAIGHRRSAAYAIARRIIAAGVSLVFASFRDPLAHVRSHPQEPILIADDNAPNVELLEVYLSGMIARSAVAVDGRDTLEKVAAFQPDLILLDIMMPKLCGFEVCKKLKDDPKTRSIMILMVTALNELGDIERAVEAGTDDFLSKPVNKVELLTRVENMLKLRHVTDEVERLRQYIAKIEDEGGPKS